MYASMSRPLSSGASLPVAIPRAQVGIDRIPGRRASNEPREAMNCKSCRKRKIKCNRLRPACDSCQTFQCECIYDAIPKKRGPKTDVLEALMRRVDGLEAKLKENKVADTSLNSLSSSASSSSSIVEKSSTEHPNILSSASPDYSTASPPNKHRNFSYANTNTITTSTDTDANNNTNDVEMGDCDNNSNSNNNNSPGQPETINPPHTDHRDDAPSPTSPAVTEELLNTYFLHLHGRPYHILDELPFRHEFKLGQIPPYLTNAVCAVACRYTPGSDSYGPAVTLSDSFSAKARSQIDTDEPSIYALQALLLLVSAFTAAGKGKKAYMMMTTAVGMAVALELHCEVGTQTHMALAQRESRRRLFWTCYILDRFLACGSKRPSLIPDSIIVLRLPSWVPDGGCPPIEGQFFQSTPRNLTGTCFSVPVSSDTSCMPQTKPQCSYGLLVGISKVLGMTNQYLATGGVKADTHFPWNPASKLVKIVQELEAWDAEAVEKFNSLQSILQHPEATILILSRLVYHSIYCLVYRTFLPVHTMELHRPSQHRTWQIQTIRACLSHADAIVDLVAAGHQMRDIRWPAFTAFCLCVSATVHIHGSHYTDGLTILGADTAASCAYLSQEMQFLEELRYSWAVVQPQLATLHALDRAHGYLVQKCSNNAQSVFSDFRLADFFDRYASAGAPKFHFDSAHMDLPGMINVTSSTGAQNDTFVASPQTTTSPMLAQQRSYAGRTLASATEASVSSLVSGLFMPQLHAITSVNSSYGYVSPVDNINPTTTSAFSFPAQTTSMHAHSSPLAAAAAAPTAPCTEASLHDGVSQAALIAVSSAGYMLPAEAALVGADAGTGSFDTGSCGFVTSSNSIDASTGYDALLGYNDVTHWAVSNDVAAATRHQRTTEKDLELLFR